MHGEASISYRLNYSPLKKSVNHRVDGKWVNWCEEFSTQILTIYEDGAKCDTNGSGLGYYQLLGKASVQIVILDFLQNTIKGDGISLQCQKG